MNKMIVSLLALTTTQLVSAPVDEKASFITTLGRDTVVVESVARAGNRVTGDIIVRVPATVRVHYDVELRADGSVARSSYESDPMGAKNMAGSRLTLDFEGDSVRATLDSAGQKGKVVHRVPKGVVPMLMTGFGASYGLYSAIGLYELLLERTKPSANDTLVVPAIDIANGTISKRKFLARSDTQIDVDYFGILWTHLTVDPTGQITAADARETTEKTKTERTQSVDIGALAKSFASADRSGKGVGAASPNLIAKGTVGGQPVVVSYGSPRRRGRVILGAVVPYDKVWRTGANEATVLTFDKDMTIGGAPVPAGAYSLWTIPKPDGTVQLIINRQHGQWGTNYDPAQDLVRVPMKASTAPAPQENFAIDIPGSGDSAELRISWDVFVWSVPLALR
ncbi:MAG TPA: DUF2911 domain-containing protein [Gemmatimonadaceae bacterium]